MPAASSRSPGQRRKNLARSVVLLISGLFACEDEGGLTAPDSEAGARHDATIAVNSWTTKTRMPTIRDHVQAGTIGNLIYVVGGQDMANSFTASRAVEAYNVATNRWSSRRQLPAARYAVNGVTPVNGLLYVTGGYNASNGHTRSFFAYNPASNSWVRKADLPGAGACGAQAVINGVFYVYAACTPNLGADRLWRYNVALDRWSSLRAPATLHAYPASGVLGGKFYVVGGLDEANHLNSTTEAYDPGTNTWTRRSFIPDPFDGTASAVVNKTLYVAGGRSGPGDEVLTLRSYNPATDRWSFLAPMPAPHFLAAGAAANGMFFVIGGHAGGAVHGYVP